MVSIRRSAIAVACLFVASVQLQAAEKDIVDTAISAGNFKTLCKAVEAAGLIETLKGEGPFTVFAPTDEAFGKIPEDALNKLVADKPMLKNVLTYHVVKGKVMASDVVKLSKAPTVFGKDISVKVEDGSVYLNGKVKVIKTDIVCKNGVIHVIDAVILPPKGSKNSDD